MKASKLRSGLNWQGAEKQKGLKEIGVQGLHLWQDRKYSIT
jgi:hypothetical protein